MPSGTAPGPNAEAAEALADEWMSGVNAETWFAVSPGPCTTLCQLIAVEGVELNGVHLLPDRIIRLPGGLLSGL
jgi:hypothetical protein